MLGPLTRKHTLFNWTVHRCGLWQSTHGGPLCLQPPRPIQGRLRHNPQEILLYFFYKFCGFFFFFFFQRPCSNLDIRIIIFLGSESQGLCWHEESYMYKVNWLTSSFLSGLATPPNRVVLAQLEQFVENDYTVVMFSGGAVYRPGWGWLFKAYRSLNRRQVFLWKEGVICHWSIASAGLANFYILLGKSFG
jgi:hypothetical protein